MMNKVTRKTHDLVQSYVSTRAMKKYDTYRFFYSTRKIMYRNCTDLYMSKDICLSIFVATKQSRYTNQMDRLPMISSMGNKT